MTHFLVYWKTYWDDVDSPLQVTCDWFTDKRDFFEEVSYGDSLWVVTGGDADHEDEWRLLQRLFVQDPDPEPSASEYGRYRIIASPHLSQLFDPTDQADFTSILKQLEFSTGKSIEFSGRKIGQALQSPRTLSPTDADTLTKYSSAVKSIDTRWASS